MEILQAIYHSLSSRELATITILGIFILWSMRASNVRKSVLRVIKCLLSPKLFAIIIILFAWITIFCYFIYYLKVWNIEYIKDVILFSLSTIPLTMETIKYSSQQEFGQLIIRQIKSAALISVYLNLYTFNYGVEIILQLFICILILTTAYVKRQNQQDKVSKRLYGCLDKSNALLGYIIFIYLIYQTLNHPITSTVENFLFGVLLPFILTIIITPYLYLLTIYGVYEMWFIRLNRSVNNKLEYKFRRGLLLKTCKLNLKKIKYFEKHIKLFLICDTEEFIYIVHQYDLYYKANK